MNVAEYIKQVNASNELDKAVDLAYLPQPFISEATRMVFLIELSKENTDDLFTLQKRRRK